MSPSLKLVYFQGGGRAEPIRLAFHIAGVEFEDVRLSGEDFGKQKADGVFPFGQVPILHVDDEVITQSGAILRYAGKLSDLYPSDTLEALRVDEIMDAFEDFMNKMIPSFFEQDQEKKLAMRKELVKDVFPVFMSKFEKKLRGKTYFGGDKMSIADLKLFTFMRFVQTGTLDGIPPTVFEAYPQLEQLRKAVAEGEKVKGYYEKEESNKRQKTSH